ncbi:MAG: TfoX/Sxy family protein [Candidatus Dormibacteria bacterium]
MAYDETLAARIRDALAGETRVSEMGMFGGLAFLVAGNMAVAAAGRGGLMVRVDPSEGETLAAADGVEVVVMRGRPMPGWLRVDGADLSSAADLRRWITRGVSFARSLPAKP